ncbi:MAG: GatB/YqeY domain-containing protein [Bacteroidota bacterium]
MSIKERLTQDLKTAMRAKDQVQLRTIRMLRAALQTREIELRKGDEVTLTEEQEIAVLQKQAKQRRDAIEQYEAADRPDLAEKEAEELSLIEGYLPQPFTDEELDALVKDVIAQTGAESMRDMGKVMGGIMPRLAGRADGRRVQLAVKSQLS